MSGITESVVEDACLGWLAALGYMLAIAVYVRLAPQAAGSRERARLAGM